MKATDMARQMRPIIEQAMQSIDGNDALTAKVLYPTFDSIIGKTVKHGFKFTYGDKLYKTVQTEITIAEHYRPGEGTESLYTEICETNAGTLADPIPYEGNMELVEGTYYSQNGVTYLCNRSTGQPVYHNLADLVGLYVTVDNSHI